MGKGAPSPPDPYKTADAQSNANFTAAQQNFGFQNVDEYTPYGSKTYTQSGWRDIYDPNTGKTIKSPTYQSNVKLSPAEQKILGKNTAMRTNLGDLGVSQSARMKNLLAKSVDTSGLQDWNAGPQAADLATTYGGDNPMTMSISNQEVRQDQTPTDRAAVEQAMMDRYSRQANPRNEAQEAEMAARGMSPGGQGYGSMKDAQNREFAEANTNAFLASGEESRASQQAYNQAAGQRLAQEGAVGTFGNTAQQQAYQQAQQRAAFSNQALGQEFEMGGQAADRGNALRQNQLGERLSLRNQDYNEMAALAGLAPVNTPNFQPFQGSSTQAAPIGQYIYDDFNARSQQATNDMSGMFNVGSAVAGALPWASWLSDRRFKQDIVPLGHDIAGAPAYHFRYISDPTTVHYGVMADEVKELHPDAVTTVHGVDYVNYDMLYQRHTF